MQRKAGIIATYDDVKAMGADLQLVDNRPKPNYEGGHVPNAINLPFVMLINPDNGYFKDEAGVRKAFEDAGVNLGKPTTFMCGAGVLATMGFIAAQGLINNIRMYDGSWSEYSAKK